MTFPQLAGSLWLLAGTRDPQHFPVCTQGRRHFAQVIHRLMHRRASQRASCQAPAAAEPPLWHWSPVTAPSPIGVLVNVTFPDDAGGDGLGRGRHVGGGHRRPRPSAGMGPANRGDTRKRLPGHTRGGVVAMAVGEVDGAPVAAVGGVRAARVRDLRTGAARGEPLQGHTGRVDAVAAREVDSPP